MRVEVDFSARPLNSMSGESSTLESMLMTVGRGRIRAIFALAQGHRPSTR